MSQHRQIAHLTAAVSKGAPSRTELVTLVFTDIVGSTALKQQLGDKAGAALTQEHHARVRHLLESFAGAEEIGTAGDSFLLRFSKPSDAVKFALSLQHELRGFNRGREAAVQDRMGIHLGEVVVAEEQAGTKPRDLYGVGVDTCARWSQPANNTRVGFAAQASFGLPKVTRL